ncbi:MAG: EamA family transporter [Actinomycetota bacterium]|nr:EamA family transporter [Actinomycetota bacterium]
MRLRGERDLLSTPATVAPERQRGAALVLAGGVLWGTSGAAQELLDGAVSPVTVGALRTVLGGLALVVIALPGLRGAVARWRLVRLPLVLAGVCVAFNQIAFFVGVRSLGIAVGTILAVGAAPFVAGAVSIITGRHRPSRRWIATTLLAVVGLMLLVRPDGNVRVSLGGAAAAVGAAAAFGLFTVLTKDLLSRGLRRLDTVVLPFIVGGLLLLPVLIHGVVTSDEAVRLVTWPGLAVVVWLAVGATAAAYLLFIAGLGGVAAVAGTTLALAEPLTAGLLGVLVFGERLGPVATVGAATVALALVLAARRPEVESAR